MVDAYLVSGEPVGSATVAENAAGEMSAATARVVLSGLADRGLVSQPHSSAGRVPTEGGLRVYVDQLVRPRAPSPRAREEVDQALRSAGSESGPVVRAAARHLASACGLTALGQPPRMDAARVHALRLVSLPPNSVLAMLVFVDGSVRHRTFVRTGDDADWQRVQNLFDRELAGHTLAAIRARLEGDVMRDSGLDAKTRALAVQTLPSGEISEDAVIIEGRNHILEHGPQLETLGDVLRTLDDKRRLLEFLDGLGGGEGTRVLLGKDSAQHGLPSCSVVAAPYSVDGQPGGTLALVGPLRVEYARVMSLVSYTADAISGILRTARGSA